MELYSHQASAVEKLKNGSILCGGVGSGKSRTSLAYYCKEQGGDISKDSFKTMNNPRDLYIITTAHKRDTEEWEEELIPFGLSTKESCNYYKNKVVIDSWNNIKKYEKVYGAFFIFDEQRVCGSGAWVKAFLKIANKNQWILLSATPGDTWADYIPVFVANGFYKNRSDFYRQHVVFSRFAKYPKIDKYLETGKLNYYRHKILVCMDFKRETVSHKIDIAVDYNHAKYKELMKTRWSESKGAPIENASELCYEMRYIVNSDPSRLLNVLDIANSRGCVIIFYNYDYELNLLRSLPFDDRIKVAEWNGHQHDPIPDSPYWVYLVQYTAGAEGWNCTRTDTMIFYSQNYSYKVMTQAAGRIDRLNTPYTDLYYYHLKSKAPIDLAIDRALTGKKRFNESAFINGR